MRTNASRLLVNEVTLHVRGKAHMTISTFGCNEKETEDYVV